MMSDAAGLREFAGSDAWMLTAVLTRGRDGREVGLVDLLAEMDWLMHLMPSFDELSYGIPRLERAGLVVPRVATDGRLTLRATAAGMALGEAVLCQPGRSWVYFVSAIEGAIGARGLRLDDPGDPSLGRLPGFDGAAFDAAVMEYAGHLGEDDEDD